MGRITITCDEGVLDAEAEAFQLFVTGELDPHETPRGRHQARVLAPAEAVNKGRESEGTVADLDVVKAALEGGLDVVVLVKGQLNPLPGEGFGGGGMKDIKDSLKTRKEQTLVFSKKKKNLVSDKHQLNFLNHRGLTQTRDNSLRLNSGLEPQVETLWVNAEKKTV